MFALVDFFGLLAFYGRFKKRYKLERIKSQDRAFYEGLHKSRIGKLNFKKLKARDMALSMISVCNHGLHRPVRM